VLSLISFLILIGVLITAHELGHFVVAKLSNVKVHTFSVGFGKAIIAKRIGETEYRLSWLPLGGYVKLDGMEREFGALEEDEDSEDSANPEKSESSENSEGRALGDKPAWVRALIFVAGPAMNLLLPFVLLPPVFMYSSAYDEVLSPLMGSVDTGLPAYRAGLRDGDLITELNGERVSGFWQVARAVDDYEVGAPPLKLTVKRPGVDEPLSVEVTPDQLEETSRFLGFKSTHNRIGFQPISVAPDVVVRPPNRLRRGPFGEAGGQHLDRVLSVNGTPIKALYELAPALNAAPADQPITLEVERFKVLLPHAPFFKEVERHTLTIEPRSEWLPSPNDVLARAGLHPARACVSSINPQSPAAQALKVGDCVLSVEGEENSLPAFLDMRLRNNPSEPKRLEILREGERLEVTLNLERVSRRDPLAGELTDWALGFTFSGMTRPGSAIMPAVSTHEEGRLGFAWHKSVTHIKRELTGNLQALGGMFSGSVSPQHLSGPVTIFYLAGREAEAGWERFMFLMVTISLSIALVNLLPVPGLDGGHILVACVEMITRRRLPLKARMALQSVGVALILMLILFALGNDLLRVWRISQGG
jgi:regulator of sigma E protease